MSYNNKPSKLPRWVNTLLVIALGWALATLTIKLIPTATSASVGPIEPTNVTSVSNAPSPAQLAQLIASTHLFGDATRAPVKEVVAPKVEAKETKLNLQLSGVFDYTPKERAIAIISAGSGEQAAYGIGDKVSGETTLKEVHKDYVILSNRGKDEKLSLPDNVQPIAMRPVVQNTQATRPTNSTGTRAANNSGPIELPSTPGALRDTLARNPSMLARIVSAEPYQENGKLLGYRITPKQNPEILEAQGIVAGDVITRVNNIQLNSQKQGIRALRNAVKAEALEVTVLRDGAEIPISISLAQ
jgi:general secretion pathway protein C